MLPRGGPRRTAGRAAFPASAATAAVATALALLPAAAGAAPPSAAVSRPPRTSGARLLTADAAFAVRADPVAIERAAGLVRSLGGEVGLAANLVSLASASALGFDALSAAGWRSIGADARLPVYFQVSAAPAGRGLRHARWIASIADRKRLAEWARALPILDRRWVPDQGGSPGPLLGAKGPAAVAAGRAVRSRGLLAAGVIPAVDALVLIRRDGDLLAIEAIAPATGLAWDTSRTELLARLDAPGARGSLADRKSAGALLLGREGIAIWTRPAGLPEALTPTALSARSCAALARHARASSLLDAALSIRIAPRSISVEAASGIAADAPLATAFPAASDRLIGPPRKTGAIAAVSLFLTGLERLRALPRGAPLHAGWIPFWRQVRGCGIAARLDAQLFLWPELAAQWLDEVATLDPAAETLIASVRNMAAAATRISAVDRRAWRGIAEVSLRPTGWPALERIVEAVFGSRRAERRPRRHHAWGKGVLRPYSLPIGRSLHLAGIGLGEDAVRWRLRHAVPDTRRAARERVLARFAGNAGAILRQLSPDLPPRAARASAAAASRVGSVSGSLRIAPGAIRFQAMLRRN